MASACQITAVVKLDAAKPSDDMHCDAQPIWCDIFSKKHCSMNSMILRNRVRFLGYAGVSVAVSIPCFFVAAFTAWKLIKAHNDSQQSHRRYGNVSNMCSLPALQQQPLKYGEPPDYQSDILTEPPSATSPGLSMSTLQAHSRTALSPDMSAQRFHLPSEEPLALQAWVASSDSPTARGDDQYEPGTPTSFIFPRFASPSQVSSVKDPWPAFTENDDRQAMPDDLSDSDAVSSLRWARDKDLASVTTEMGKELDERHPNPTRLDRNGRYRPPICST